MTAPDIQALADSLVDEEERWLRLAADFKTKRYSDYILSPSDPDYRAVVLTLTHLGLLEKGNRMGREVYRITGRGQQVVDVLGQPVAGSEVQSD